MKRKTLFWTSVAAVIGAAIFFTPKVINFLVLSEIQYDRPHEPLFETRPLTSAESAEVTKALSQDYTYFGKGGQAYVFFSHDGKYAIKFFKQRHFRYPKYLDYLPLFKSYKTHIFEKRQQVMRKEYGSYKIGFEELPHETAILYVHLNKTDHLHKSIDFKDRFGFVHPIDLDKTDFILQRRATLVFDKISEQMAQKDVEGAKKTITNIIGLIKTCAKKGFHDNDPKISTNCGMIGDQAVKIDVGRFTYDDRMKKPLFLKPELYHHTRSFKFWLSKHYPELIPHLDEEVLQVIIHE